KGSGRWDYRLGCPWLVVQDDGSLRLYYIGSNEAVGSGTSELDVVHQIGLAVSAGDITEWQRFKA
ncbi:MAG: glycosyl hydrolase, partial [Gammaproteobacteria bacterium]|nr:glycosyl hydrolase [Gammaproteobacteria bacterium]